MEDLERLQYLVQNIICAVKISVNTKAKIPQTKFHKKAHFADQTRQYKQNKGETAVHDCQLAAMDIDDMAVHMRKVLAMS